MNIYAWVGMLGIIVFTILPLFNKKRTREEVQKAIVTVGIVIGIIELFIQRKKMLCLT